MTVLLFADRVQETTITTGSGTVTLAGAVPAYRAFSTAFSDGDSVRYVIVGGAEWEVGEGIYTGGTLSRVTVFTSSNANALVVFSAGSKYVWCDIPAATFSNLGAGQTTGVLFRDASENLGVSTAFTVDDAGTSQVLQVISPGQTTVMRGIYYSGSAVLGANIVMQKARGSAASPTKVLSGDIISSFIGRGYHEDGTPGFAPSTNGLQIVAEQDFTATTSGTAIIFTLAKLNTATGAEVYRVSGSGFQTVTCKALASGSVGIAKWTGAAHTAQTASTELNDWLLDGSAILQFATGNITTERQNLIKARTYAFVGASTITDTATLAIDKAPVAGTNATLTRAYSFWCQAGLARFDGNITFAGSGAATVGHLRAATGAQVHLAQRNSGGTVDLSLLEIDASDNLWVGGDAALTSTKTVPQLNLSAQTSGSFWVGTAEQIRLDGTLVNVRVPQVGYAAANSVWGAVDGQVTVAVSTTDVTLTAAQYSRKMQKFTGAPLATRTITYPAPADGDHSYVRHLQGAQTVSPLTISTGTGTTAVLAAGVAHTYQFTPDGVLLLT